MSLPVDLETAGRAVAIGVPAIVTLIGFTRGPGGVRSRLRHDLDLLEKIPPDTKARETFEAYLEERIRQFTRYETEATRDIQGLVIGSMLVALFVAIGLWLFTLGHWYWDVGAVAILVFAAAGLSSVYDDAQKVPRDQKNNRL